MQLRGNIEQAAIHYEAALKALSHSTVTAVEQSYFYERRGRVLAAYSKIAEA